MRLTRDEKDQLAERKYREAEQEQIDAPTVEERFVAANQGRMAGVWGHGAALNPYAANDPLHDIWEKQRMFTLSVRMNGPALRRMP